MSLEINLVTFSKKICYMKNGKEIHVDESFDLDPELTSKKSVSDFLKFIKQEIVDYGESIYRLNNIALGLEDLEKVLKYLTKNTALSKYSANNFLEIAEKGNKFFIIEVW